MRTVETNVYQFNELSEDAKAKAIEGLLDLNIDYDWWKFVYEDAENIGLKISSFDLYRPAIDGAFTLSAEEVAANIMRDHGDSCDAYKIAEQYIEKHDPIFSEYFKEPENMAEIEEDLIELENEFLRNLLQCYLSILASEYEYRTSEMAIIESIEAHEYEFTEDGKLF